jgi:hypothetical protein
MPFNKLLPECFAIRNVIPRVISFCFTVLMFSSIAWAAEVLVCFKEGLEKL